MAGAGRLTLSRKEEVVPAFGRKICRYDREWCRKRNGIEDPNNKLALEEIRKEAKVKEAIITDANVLYVTVEDDGTRRDGYAGYLCEVLNDHKATAKTVKVVKVNSSKDPDADNTYGVLLGEMNCEF